MSLLSFRVRLARLGGDSPGPNRVGPDGLDHGRQTIAQRGPDGAIPRQNIDYGLLYGESESSRAFLPTLPVFVFRRATAGHRL